MKPTRPNIRCAPAACIVWSVMLLAGDHGFAQEPRPAAREASPIERLGPNLLRIDTLTVDTEKKVVTVKGFVNDVNILEFIANPRNGAKAYESALTLDTTGVNFNLAMILIGLDPARSTPSTKHLDPTPPKGDPVEMLVEWEDGGTKRSVRAEELVWNNDTKRTLSPGPWVYTGSVFVKEGNAYLADLQGSLIGFVHTPAPVIESPRPLLPGDYGASVLNPALKLKAGTPIVMIIRRPAADKR